MYAYNICTCISRYACPCETREDVWCPAVTAVFPSVSQPDTKPREILPSLSSTLPLLGLQPYSDFCVCPRDLNSNHVCTPKHSHLLSQLLSPHLPLNCTGQLTRSTVYTLLTCEFVCRDRRQEDFCSELFIHT